MQLTGIMVLFVLTLAYVLLRFERVQASTNRTIDDQNGDSLTGALPAYFPENVWIQGSECSTCAANVSYQQAFDHSESALVISDTINLTCSKHGMMPQSTPQIPRTS
jgi:hypothetical protein